MKNNEKNKKMAKQMSARLSVTIRGAVQGVGFRPFVYRLATEMQLPGWVSNTTQGVFVEVEGHKLQLDSFLLRLQNEKPPRSFIQSLEYSFLDPVGFSSFEIHQSNDQGIKTTLVLPDIATCPDCLKEIVDPTNRRYLYPFTNCTNCGPRFSIIESLPYDRPNTTMKKFTMCPECQREYDDLLDRRFHAQPNACPMCGPHLELWDERGEIVAKHHIAIRQAVKAIRAGKIVAVKSLGGFQLLASACNEQAVRRLRERKRREEKPFAVMLPSLEMTKEICVVSSLEERLLLSPESPIVLLERKGKSVEIQTSEFGVRHKTFTLASSVAPNNPYLGVMLPYTPLHHIVMEKLRIPVVATSGNISDEPICTDEYEALKRLHGIADMFLVHNRPIVRHVDDSVVRVMMGRELVLRRARGYAPLPISIQSKGASILAVGGHLKNTVALASDRNIFISQHIGDLETHQSLDAFRKVANDLQQLYDVKPHRVVCDMHPDYISSKLAHTFGTDVTEVQHHYAHVAACMADNQLKDEVLGVSWDGTGFGLDGTIWGGEFLLTSATSFKRVATFRSFQLPGGEKAIKEPRRTALGVLYEAFGDAVLGRSDTPSVKTFSKEEMDVVRQMLAKGINSPITTSAGRLFDAVASLLGMRQHVNFEGQAAMELEFSIGSEETNEEYTFSLTESQHHSHDHDDDNDLESILNVDWAPMILELLEDFQRGIPVPRISAKFHNTMAEIIVAVAKRIGQNRVVLTGGCFQNKYLTERAVQRLQAEGFHPYWHQRVPPNDGGISLGQVYALTRMKRTRKSSVTHTLEEVAS